MAEMRARAARRVRVSCIVVVCCVASLGGDGEVDVMVLGS